jgi:hypothetical protein
VDPANADRHAAAGSALPGALGRWLTRAQLAESLQLIDHKIDVYRGRTPALGAQTAWR